VTPSDVRPAAASASPHPAAARTNWWCRVLPSHRQPLLGHGALELLARKLGQQHLARFKAPKAIKLGDLPKTSTGKIQKFALRVRAR
jgi:fatty-acyl-CoA synthase